MTGQRQLISTLAIVFALGLAPAFADAGEPEADHRAWQHGIELIPVGDRLLLVWGSPGNPPHANPGGDWEHDIYYAWVNAGSTRETVLAGARLLVSAPEAQEPPSMAINASGKLLLTSEDGNGGINQQAGLWDSDLRPLRKYPFMIRRGGHSGHVAAIGERFLVVYGEGWVERGGFLDAGTGMTIEARLVEGDGTLHKAFTIAAGHRDGWPLVAASGRNGLVIWQRYPALTLQMALISAAGKVEKQGQLAADLPLRYAYDVEFSPRLSRYVVVGSSDDGGFISLITLAGEVSAVQHGLPQIASESRIIIGEDGSGVIGVYPVSPHGVAVVRLAGDEIELLKVIDHPYEWDYAGTTGTFVAPDRVVFFTLSKTGLQRVSVDLH